LKGRKVNARPRRVKTFEESSVEFAFLIGMPSGLFLFVLVYILTPLSQWLIELGYPNVLSGMLILIAFFQVLCSFLFGLRSRFSREQNILVLRYTAVVFFLSGILVGYNYLVYLVIAPMLPDPHSAAIPTVATMCLLLLVFFGLFKRFFSQWTNQWFRIKYVSGKGLPERALQNRAKAEIELARKNYENASKDYHAAALEYVNMGNWREAAKDYWLAAESLSKASNLSLGFGATWLYVLAGTAYLLDSQLDKAKEALNLGKEMLGRREMEKDGRERLSLLVNALSTLIEGDSESTAEMWGIVNRKVGRWGYPVTEETLALFEKASELIHGS